MFGATDGNKYASPSHTTARNRGDGRDGTTADAASASATPAELATLSAIPLLRLPSHNALAKRKCRWWISLTLAPTRSAAPAPQLPSRRALAKRVRKERSSVTLALLSAGRVTSWAPYKRSANLFLSASNAATSGSTSVATAMPPMPRQLLASPLRRDLLPSSSSATFGIADAGLPLLLPMWSMYSTEQRLGVDGELISEAMKLGMELTVEAMLAGDLLRPRSTLSM
mmetsp:Transcript_7588/g.19326  ORF Transcript_7588/g.19326 Transcript_7588/m.19326 type:complete len:227 (+) Transcript_7588:519-1199(+)